MKKKGFTLAEILISIGILAVGLSMAAAIFPTAIREYEKSNRNVLGSIICRNALSLGKVSLYGDNGDNTNNRANEVLIATTLLEDKTAALGANVSAYPSGDPNSPLGFFIFAKSIGEAYQITAVSYKKKTLTSTVLAKQVTCTIAADGVSVTGTDMHLSSPLLVRGNGEFGKIEAVNDTGTVATLDRKLTPGSNLSCFIFKDADDSVTMSPAMFILTTRTGLQEAPL